MPDAERSLKVLVMHTPARKVWICHSRQKWISILQIIFTGQCNSLKLQAMPWQSYGSEVFT